MSWRGGIGRVGVFSLSSSFFGGVSETHSIIVPIQNKTKEAEDTTFVGMETCGSFLSARVGKGAGGVFSATVFVSGICG